MSIKTERRDGHEYVIDPITGTRILLTEPIARLIRDGFKPCGPGCLHWLVDGGRWRCFYSDTNRRAPFPCRLPIGGDWHHPSSWAHHWDGSRVLHLEPHGLSASSASLLSRFAERYLLRLEIESCQRHTSPAIGINLELQGGRAARAPQPRAPSRDVGASLLGVGATE
jgi:hypothetical protein